MPDNRLHGFVTTENGVVILAMTRIDELIDCITRIESLKRQKEKIEAEIEVLGKKVFIMAREYEDDKRQLSLFEE